MNRKRCYYTGLIVIVLLISALRARAQFTINGLTDKAVYNDTVSFSVVPQAGYTCAVLLNTNQVPTGVSVPVNQPDYYELKVSATSLTTGLVTTQVVRFIVKATQRGDTEWGLPPQTPLPLIPSAPGEVAAAHLRLIAPQDFPAGYEIPIVAWVLDAQDHAVRANGMLAADGHPAITLKRGVGSGFLAANNPPGPLTYAPALQGLSTNKTINVEASTTWSDVAGVISGNVVWPDNSRIRVTTNLLVTAGATLTIGAGTIVQLNPWVNITNNGAIAINGTIERPVVFMPISRTQPWGGFFMRTSTGSIDAAGTIFTGSGANPTGGAGHRQEQCLFLVDSSPRLTFTDSAAIYLAGQLGHAYNGGTFTFTRFLLQHAVTGGEYTGANFTVNDSAFIEFPDDTPSFVDGDNDALYLVSGTHYFTNTLIGWTKDDGIDSGGDGLGRLHYERCWFEATMHEGNSLSGLKNTTAFGTVYQDCGQGLEDGYGPGSSSYGPTGRVDACLFAACKVGVRHGDNYASIGNGYPGIIGATNSIFLFNHHDVFGYNWRSTGWTNAVGQMSIQNNWLTIPDPAFPNNSTWDPAADGWRLASFMTTPPDAPVGIGLAIRTNQLAMTSIYEGVPVRLSSFTTNFVSVSYTFLDSGDDPRGTGTLTFAPGETVKRIYFPGFQSAGQSFIRVILHDPVGGELTGETSASFQGTSPAVQTGLSATASQLPGYRLLEGPFLRLNAPTADAVSVDYQYESGGATLASGTIRFQAGETLKSLSLTGVNLFDYNQVQLTVGNAAGATLIGITSVTYSNAPVTMMRLAVATNQLSLDSFPNGLILRLNGPAPSGVGVDFKVEGAGGVLTNGTLAFGGGALSALLTAPTVNLAECDLLRVSFSNAQGAPWSGLSTVYFVRTGEAPPAGTNVTLVAQRSVWKYLDTGVDAGTLWRNLAYSDSGWLSGCAQLGYNDGDECTVVGYGTNANAKYITTYFRQTFVVADPGQLASLSLWLLRDDGGVVYLNGAEVYRSPSMPGGTINYLTLADAQGSTAPPDNTVDTATLSPTVLVAGTNIAAVEIHQHRPNSSDLSFDFGLTAQSKPPAVPQQLYWTSFEPGQWTLAWADGSFVLQQSDKVTGPWTNAPVSSPVFISPTNSQQFFRLIK